MSYNKAREERKWKKWKSAEEKQLRVLGVSEDIILRLRTYDWELFKSERNYRRWNTKDDEYLKKVIDAKERPVETMEQLLDQVEDERLYSILSTLDKLTLQILLYKVEGFSDQEIGKVTGIRSGTITTRFYRLRKKLKNF